MELIIPNMAYANSYYEYIQQLGSEERYPFPLDFDYSDFGAYLAKVNDFTQGRNLPEGYVQSSTLWLMDHDEIVGVTNIRHNLNDAIEYCGGHIGLSIKPSQRRKSLGKTLMQMSIDLLTNNLGVEIIHIHCHQTNISSSKTIQACGGELESVIDEGGAKIERYLVGIRNKERS